MVCGVLTGRETYTLQVGQLYKTCAPAAVYNIDPLQLFLWLWRIRNQGSCMWTQ